MAIVVEFLSRSLHTTGHKVVNADVITVGRGYSCDIHVDDPYVCPLHLNIQRDAATGALQFTDNKSVNGVKINGERKTGAAIEPTDVITVGRTHLRILDADTDVVPTLTLSALEENISWMSNVKTAIVLTCLALSSLMLDHYLTTYDAFKASNALSQSLGIMLLFSLWPLGFGLLAKLSKKDPKLAGQFSLMWLVLLGIQGLSVFEVWLSFNMLTGELYQALSLLVIAGGFFGFCWFSLFIAFHQRQQTRNRIASVLTLALFVPMTFFQYHGTEDFSEFPAYNINLLPPVYQISQPNTVETMLEASAQLFDDVHEQEAKKP